MFVKVFSLPALHGVNDLNILFDPVFKELRQQIEWN